MALLGISLIVASVVFVILRPPPWLWLPWHSAGRPAAITDGKETQASNRDRDDGQRQVKAEDSIELKGSSTTTSAERTSSTLRQRKPEDDAPNTLPTIQPPTITPPRLSLQPSKNRNLQLRPKLKPQLQPSLGRIPSLNQFPAPNSPQRARGPAPDRGLSASSSGLAPPPTLSSKPSKPSRKVVLTPGHSPLDWARISGPNADLRGVASLSPYLRVTPSMLKVQTGRKGTDAWMAINGKVYNVTPYAKFHPGGVPELMRGAGRDGTKLFGEIHPWVNYETMLAACLVGLLVDEPDGKESEMDKMD
ncbi:hypothetical protein TrVFT333_003017 [Trichoderma virens FT-333]|nr:hypothetical protein TrVFT333_003017 [Trichoderma virens FT-333]